MKKICKPIEQVKEVYNVCISKINDDEKKKIMEECIDELVEDEKLYEEKAMRGELSQFPQKEIMCNAITIEEMKKVYSYRMVNKKQPGRIYYNKLLNLVEICPFCGVRDVSTLDHYLPKSKYASIVVTPINLLPVCRDCNINKDTINPVNDGEEIWHPYYDDFQQFRWLFVCVKQVTPPNIKYYINIPDDLANDKIIKKIKSSFIRLKLGSLYSKNAVKEMKDIEFYMKTLKTNVGISGVKQQLEMMYESFKQNDINSWKVALYENLKDNDWYIEKYL